MAEERIIDDDLDKNKKFKIRKNEDGEDELYFDGEEQSEYGAEFYEIPAFSGGGEDGGSDILTPDQLAAREEARRLAEENNRLYVEGCIKKAEGQLGCGDFESALYSLNSAQNSDDRCGRIYALKLRALTRNFSDYTVLDECVACSEGIRHYCTEEQKEELNSQSQSLKKRLEALEEKAAGLHTEVESKKSERRAVFSKSRNGAIKLFTFTAVPFLVCLILTLSFGSVMFAKQNGTNLILTVVFGVLAAILFVVSLITFNKLWTAMRKYSLNEQNSSTRAGREYEELLSEIKKLKTVLSSFEK